MNTRIQRAILTATILTFAAAPLLFAGELPYSWYVNANGEEGTLQVSTGAGGTLTGILLGQPVEGWLIGHHLLLARQGAKGLESWEAWVGTSTGANDEVPVIAGTFTRPGEEGPLPWFGTGHPVEVTSLPPSSAQQPTRAPLIPPQTPKTPPSNQGTQPQSPTVAPHLPGGQPSLAGTWQTPDGPLKIRQTASKLIFELPSGEVSGRLTGPDSLIGGFGPGCCKGHIEQAYTIIAWDNGTRWFRQ